MYINHNQMAGNVANTLTSHYSNLATSTQRLSSGLRVNSAADDAAGLAIRELMRADISALQQGVRNANDAISLIQTADGALGIIDEKLIRMKELAEQAATGTYDSTQRLMIESEYQAMASEITRIANATDFNGIKLLDGSLEGTHDGSGLESKGELKVHFGSGNNSAEDYYYIGVGEMTAAALGVGNASTWQDVMGRASEEFGKSLTDAINKNEKLTDAEKGQLLSQVGAAVQNYETNVKNAANLQNAYQYWGAGDAAGDDGGFLSAGKTDAAGSLMADYMAVANQDAETAWKQAIDQIVAPAMTDAIAGVKWNGGNNALDGTTGAGTDAIADITAVLDDTDIQNKLKDTLTKLGLGDQLANFATWIADAKTAAGTLTDTAADTAVNKAGTDMLDSLKGNVTTAMSDAARAAAITNFQEGNGTEANPGLRDTQMQKLGYAFAHAAMYNMSGRETVPATATIDGTANTANYTEYGIDGNAFDFGMDASLSATAQAEAAAMLKEALGNAYDKVENMDFAGHTIETQEDAQKALEALDAAIVTKDKTRAHLGALQNRLENTVSNLTTQSENLQAAESRISDVDVATEMTQFVRNQILTQSAVAMLSQANSMPQMAMQLIH